MIFFTSLHYYYSTKSTILDARAMISTSHSLFDRWTTIIIMHTIYANSITTLFQTKTTTQVFDRFTVDHWFDHSFITFWFIVIIVVNIVTLLFTFVLSAFFVFVFFSAFCGWFLVVIVFGWMVVNILNLLKISVSSFIVICKIGLIWLMAYNMAL